MQRPARLIFTSLCNFGLSLVLGVGGAAAAPLHTALDAMGPDAEIVIVVPSMSALSEQIAALSAQVGLSEHLPELENGLGMFKRQMSFVEGVDDGGALLVTVSGLAEAAEAALDQAQGAPAPSTLLLVPVSDYGAFVTNLEGDPAAAVSAVTLRGSQEGFARKLEGYAVLGETRAAVEAYQPARGGDERLAGLGELLEPYARQAQSLVWIDIAALRPALERGLNEATAAIADAPQMGDEQSASNFIVDTRSATRTIVQLYEQAGTLLIDGSDELILALEITDAGLGLSMLLDTAEGSPLASFFAPPADAQQADEAPDAGGAAALLSSLPDRPFIYAASIDSDTFRLAPMLEALFQAMDGREEAGLMSSMYRDTLALMKDVQGLASVFYALEPASMMTGGLLNTLTLYDVEDAQAFIAQQKEIVETLGELTIPLGAATQEGQPTPEMGYTTNYTEGALELAGTSVDQYQVNLVLPPEMTRQLNPMVMALANSGYGGYVAGKDGKVLMTTVTDPQLITRALEAIDAGEGIGAAGPIAQLRETALPPDASLELYLSPAGIIESLNPFLTMMSPDAQPIDVPADLPPLAMGAAGDGQGAVFRLFIPAETVAFGVTLYNEMAAQGMMEQGANVPPGAARR